MRYLKYLFVGLSVKHNLKSASNNQHVDMSSAEQYFLGTASNGLNLSPSSNNHDSPGSEFAGVTDDEYVSYLDLNGAQGASCPIKPTI